MNNDLKKQISELPRLPGVYLFKDQEGEILYIGKAISLRDRVRSYLSPKLGEERGRQFEGMIKRVKTVEIRETRFEVEALLLEAKLIRCEKPLYNIRLRDDKSFAVIVVDCTSDFPQITTTREVDIERICTKLKRERSLSISQKIANIEYFGPYLSSESAKHALSTLRRAFKFRDCSSVKFRHYQKLGRGCLFQSVHLCAAPCIGAITKTDYHQLINNIREFLCGSQTKVIRDLEAEMKRQTKNENFERAVLLRDQIFALSKIQMQAKISIGVGHAQPAGSGKNQEERRKKKVRLLRIEAFDISNISGEYAVGAMAVAFTENRRQITEDRSALRLPSSVFRFAKQFYRRFKIRTVEGANDMAMMQEVLSRRLRHLSDQSADWARPNLIFIDGGRAHLNAANRILSVGVGHIQPVQSKIPIIAVAKGPSRKKVDLYMKKEVKEKFRDIDLGKIAEKMREEAHRFAIGYYRTRHRKGMVGKYLRK